MRAVFGEKPLAAGEIAALSALLRQLEVEGSVPASSVKGTVLLAGTGGATCLLLVFGWAWRERLRAVRQPMVQAYREGESDGRS